MDDLSGYLEAFGTRCRVKGFEYLGIVEDAYSEIEMGRTRAASTAPEILFTQADVSKMNLASGDLVEVYSETSNKFERFLARNPQPRSDGFSKIPCIEPN